MNDLRIVSFLPAATEMVCSLGLAENLVGITHECDFPPEIRDRPRVVRNTVSMAGLQPSEIDLAVRKQLGAGESLYYLDENLLRDLAPHLVLTQDLCRVCGLSSEEMSRQLDALRTKPTVLTFNPKTLADIEDNLRELAKTTGRLAQAEEQIASGRRKIQAVKQLVGNATQPRAFCMEWVDPVYCGGHWFAEMIELAGGCDRLSRKGVDSIRVPWEELLAWAPEVLVIAPCGFDSANALKQTLQLRERPGWNEIPAVKKGRVYAVDANSYFARPGPRVIAGVELLAHLIHPELFRWNGPAEAFVPLL